eukprot:CAMPEP_0174835476 /NCGR_PEP_ID=MMETSP1114-20130205/5427_1 /TAXON_ID=312471 /ORGANISM="Neobodo designis, Strain CCAP 1951/1" /LENGTH=243 /DNA_ID=CAMNT_0016069425 /DNA_START=50 /DNA_END=781 /DNA_ORIENTATION=+
MSCHSPTVPLLRACDPPNATPGMVGALQPLLADPGVPASGDRIDERGERIGPTAQLQIEGTAALYADVTASTEMGLCVVADLQEQVLRMADFCDAQEALEPDGSGAAWAELTPGTLADVACTAFLVSTNGKRPDVPPLADLASAVASETYSDLVADAPPTGTKIATVESWAGMVRRLLRAALVADVDEPMPVQATPRQLCVSAARVAVTPPTAAPLTCAVAQHHTCSVASREHLCCYSGVVNY